MISEGGNVKFTEPAFLVQWHALAFSLGRYSARQRRAAGISQVDGRSLRLFVTRSNVSGLRN